MRGLKLFITFALLLTGSSCEELLLEQDISGENLQLLAPTGEVLLETSDVSFHWAAVEGAFSYQLQIASPHFEAPQQWVTDIILEENLYSEVLPAGAYEWRVRAINSGYGTAYATAAFSVEIPGDFSDQQVHLYSPAADFLSGEERISLNWGAVEDASTYRVQIVAEGQVVQEQTTGATNIELGFPQGASIWRVRGENERHSTLYSERNLVVDGIAPATPQLLRPADEAELDLPAVSFEWSREEMEGSEERDSLFIYKDIELTDPVLKEQVTHSYQQVLEREKTYYWFMRAYDAAGNRGAESEVFSFSIN